MTNSIIQKFKNKYEKIYPTNHIYIGFYDKQAQYKDTTFIYHHYEYFIGDATKLPDVKNLKCLTDESISFSCDLSNLKRYQDAKIMHNDQKWTILYTLYFTNLYNKSLAVTPQNTSLNELQKEIDIINKNSVKDALKLAKTQNTLDNIFQP